MVDILKHMEQIGPCGQTLSVAERAGLEVSMLQREQEEALPRKLLFWGKVSGDKDDYLVCFCFMPATLESGDFPTRKYYYCRSSDTTLVQMPVLDAAYRALAANITGRFVGEPSFPLDQEPEEEQADEDKEPERFREQHRLAYVVEQIDHDVAVTPLGALTLQPSHQVSLNPAFEGLSFECSAALNNYFHFRAPESIESLAAFSKKGLVRGSDFLDPLTADRPQGVWSISHNSSKTTAILRNWLWPGYFFFATVSEKSLGGGGGETGSVYFGNGTRNTDLAFML